MIPAQHEIMRGWPADANPVVSIVCVTYNHGKYLRDAIHGFLMQLTDFPFEIIIHDDASVDSTPEIIREYARKYPNLIKPIMQAENQYSKGLKIFPLALPQARGKYIAQCEGDDYWIDPYKIQKQVDLLTANPTFSMCFHPVTRLIENFVESQVEGEQRPPSLKHAYTLEDLITYDNFIPSCSVLFRRENVRKVPVWLHEMPYGDWPLHLINAQQGDLAYLEDVMAVYRIHPKGAWSSLDHLQAAKNRVKAYRLVGKHLCLQGKSFFQIALARKYTEMAKEYDRLGQKDDAKAMALEALKLSRNIIVLRKIAKIYFSIFSVNVWRLLKRLGNER
jgi:glycosyltransferase involved in cell wall biosynthesis